MNLRFATIDDLPEIVAIYNTTIASRQVTADVVPVTVEERRGWFAAHDQTTYPMYVAHDAHGQMIGWLSYSAFHPRAAYRATAELSIYLAPSARGRGFGSTLLAFAIKEAPKLGFETLIGLIFGHNQPSLALFQRYQFKHFGKLPRVAELDGIKRDLIIVGRSV